MVCLALLLLCIVVAHDLFGKILGRFRLLDVDW